MSDLIKQKCVACRADAPRVTDDELPDLLKQIPDWQPITTESVLKLNKVFNFEKLCDTEIRKSQSSLNELLK